MKQVGSILALTVALASFSATQAQDVVDIGLYEGENGNLEVRVVPHADFDGIFSSVVFTLRWDATSDAVVGEPLQNDAEHAAVSLERSGELHQEGSSNYQVYAGFGMQRLEQLGQGWEAGKEYTIATIPVEGDVEVELLNDAWTADERNNGDYYVSLGGQEFTGSILKSLAEAGTPGFNLSIMPNPNHGLFAVMFESVEGQDVNVDVVNSIGLVVRSQQFPGASGKYRIDMDLTNMSDGVYYLKVQQGEHTVIRKILFQ